MRALASRLERAFIAANYWLLIVLLAAMACIVFSNVVLRYLTNQSLVWAEEVARHLMIWLTFVGAGLALRWGAHVAMDTLQDVLPARGGLVVRVAIVALMIALFLVMGSASFSYVDLMKFQTTPATQISFAWVYSALPLGFVLLLIHLLLVARQFIVARRLPDLRVPEDEELPQ